MKYKNLLVFREFRKYEICWWNIFSGQRRHICKLSKKRIKAEDELILMPKVNTKLKLEEFLSKSVCSWRRFLSLFHGFPKNFEGKYVTIFSWTKNFLLNKKNGMERSYVQDYNIKSYLAHTSLYESARKNEKISLQFATKHTCVCVIKWN